MYFSQIFGSLLKKYKYIFYVVLFRCSLYMATLHKKNGLTVFSLETVFWVLNEKLFSPSKREIYEWKGIP